jgi:hypothetical protein
MYRVITNCSPSVFVIGVAVVKMGFVGNTRHGSPCEQGVIAQG